MQIKYEVFSSIIEVKPENNQLNEQSSGPLLVLKQEV